MRLFCIKTILLCGAAGLVPLNPAMAQSEAGETADENVIIVTAQNRSQNVQDVPIAISVIGGNELKSAGVTDLLTLQRVAPVLQIVNDTVQTRVTVRGVGSNSNDEAQDQAIAINIDGEYINRPTVLNAALFDLDRVEVLRGPQGTLYGRNATGGAVNFITRKPGSALAANGSVSYGNFNHVLAEGGLTVPLGDIGGIRAAGIYSKRDGYNFHPNVNLRSGDDNTWGGRVSLRLEPAAGLKINAAVERVEQDLRVPAQAFFNFNAPGNSPGAGCAANPGFVEIAPAVPGTQCIPVNTTNLARVNRSVYDAPTTGVGNNTQNSTAARGSIAYDFGGATLTYIGGYRETDRGSAVPLSPGYRFNTYIDTIKTNSHEVRLNGESDLLVWQAGGFYFNEKLEVERGLYRSPPPPFLLGANGGYVNYFQRSVSSRSWALFGQTDVKLSDKVTLVGGLRYTDDKRTARYRDYGGAIANPTNPLFNTGSVRPANPGTPLRNLSLGSNADKLTWLAGINYKPDPDTLIYGKVSTGFKAGGFDSVGQYAPETNTAYEAGLKKSFGETAQHTFNLAGFYYDYRDLQVGVLLDTTKGSQIFNAGKAVIWGVEAEARIALSDNDTFSATVNYLNAEYKQLLTAIPVFCVAGTGCRPGGGNGELTVGNLETSPGVITQPDLAGNTPPMTPTWTITLGYDKVIPLGTAGSLTASVFSTFKSSYFGDVFNYRDSRQTAFTQTDLSLTWTPENKRWNLQGFVRNIENSRPLTYAGFTVAGPDDIYNWQFSPPRTYGVRLSFDF
ncbi:TonB-dependent receptor [Novosphingobium aerophilum]|uniref:TonB-dependent receptor n=1 Tax=Novosphingobium aerophilum TaxID=2839843 RepID=UPI001FD20FF6|nr:TonB-dependent receptor [Novosphingobium aerophilum]